MKKLAIIGTKEFAVQITNYALQTDEFEVVGYYDNVEPQGGIINGRPVFGTVLDAIEGYNTHVFDEIFIAVGYTRFDLRELFFAQLKGKVPFATIINPKAIIGANVQLGEGVYIGPEASIGSDTIIEDNVFIHGGTRLGHNNHIGSHSYFSGRIDTAGYCTIGKRCFVGICVCVADHLSICDDVWVGLGCIVAKSIKKPGKYVSPSIKLIKIE